jgi:hypothetical protein
MKSTLPCYLQKGQVARYTLNDFNQKAYENNNYTKRDAGVDFTSFKTGPSTRYGHFRGKSSVEYSRKKLNASISSDDSFHDFLRTKGSEMF